MVFAHGDALRGQAERRSLGENGTCIFNKIDGRWGYADLALRKVRMWWGGGITNGDVHDKEVSSSLLRKGRDVGEFRFFFMRKFRRLQLQLEQGIHVQCSLFRVSCSVFRVPCSVFCVQWFNGSIVQWFSGSVVQWFSGSVVQWFNGSMVKWFSGSMIQWFNGSVVQWFNDSMVQWLSGSVVQRFNGSVVRGSCSSYWSEQRRQYRYFAVHEQVHFHVHLSTCMITCTYKVHVRTYAWTCT